MAEGIITGRQDLLLDPKTLADEFGREAGKVAFHGTKVACVTVIPHEVVWRHNGQTYPDSDGKVICADTKPLVPVLMAIRQKSLNLTPGVSNRLIYFGNDFDGVDIWMTREHHEKIRAATGYVACMDGEVFNEITPPVPAGYPMQKIPRPRELRTSQFVDPFVHLEVNGSLLDELVAADPTASIRYLDNDGALPAHVRAALS